MFFFDEIKILSNPGLYLNRALNRPDPRARFSKVPNTYRTWNCHSKISNLVITELLYSHVLEVLFIQEVSSFSYTDRQLYFIPRLRRQTLNNLVSRHHGNCVNPNENTGGRAILKQYIARKIQADAFEYSPQPFPQNKNANFAVFPLVSRVRNTSTGNRAFSILFGYIN